MKLYLTAGENESSSMVSDMARMRDLLYARGFSMAEINYQTEPGTHSEAFWAGRFPDVYTWLFADELSNKKIIKTEQLIYPNPLKDTFRLSEHAGITEVSMYDLSGKFLYLLRSDKNGVFRVKDAKPGTYLITGKDHKNRIFSSKIMIE